MTKVTFTLNPTVDVTVKGWKDDYDLLYTPPDYGFIRRFVKFLEDEHIVPIYPPCRGNGGEHGGIFSVDDAKKIEDWLLKEGAKKK